MCRSWWYIRTHTISLQWRHTTIASQITSLTIVYSTVYSGVDQGKHQSSASLAFVWGIHRWPVNSPHKWPVTRKMFPFDDVIMLMMDVYMAYVRIGGMMSQIIWFISFHVGIRIMENFHRHRNGFIVPAIWRTNYRNKHRIYEIKTPIIQLIERGISMGRFVCVQNRHCWSLLAIFEPLKNYFITCQKKWLLLRPSVSTVRPTRKVSLGPAKVRETPSVSGTVVQWRMQPSGFTGPLQDPNRGNGVCYRGARCW